MNEMLLQFIWQYSLYHPVGLKTDRGEPVTMVHPGMRNLHAGPDFEEARIRIADTMLVGKVELHVRASDWRKHGHHTDEQYRNIIVHVVYEDDMPGEIHPFAKLELKKHISPGVITKYTDLIQTTQPIPCSRQLHQVKALTKESWLQRLLAERWEEKLVTWQELLDQSAGDWRNLLYWRLAANFGFKVNEAPFLMLARSLPVNILARHKESLFQLEALLFGQAGMLADHFADEYPKRLQSEYGYLRQKYKLQGITPMLWRFMRMRPSNFPTIRIAQFAALVHRSLHLFSKIVSVSHMDELGSLLKVSAGDYWMTRYRFDDIPGRTYEKRLGAASVDNILINTIAPVQFLFGLHHGDITGQERALDMLGSVAPERNRIITIWEAQHWKAGNAAQSQALLQLFNRYCSRKRCLECAVGLSVIRSQPVK